MSDERGFLFTANSGTGHGILCTGNHETIPSPEVQAKIDAMPKGHTAFVSGDGEHVHIMDLRPTLAWCDDIREASRPLREAREKALATGDGAAYDRAQSGLDAMARALDLY